MKPSIAIEIIARALLWIFIFSGEMVIGAIIDYVPLTYMFYVTLIVFTTLLFLSTSWLGENKLVLDIRELCFYDIVVQCIGLTLYFCWYVPSIHISLCYVVLILKFSRLLWLAKTADGSALVGWPVFGPVGYLRTLVAEVNTPQSLASPRQNEIAYAFMMATLPSVYLLHIAGLKMKLSFWASIVLCIIVLGFKRFITYLEEQHAQQIAKDKALIIAEANAALAEERSAFNAAKAALADELTTKNTQLLESNRQRAALAADLANRNEILRNASHDLKLPVGMVSNCIDRLERVDDTTQRVALTTKLRNAVDSLSGAIETTIHNAKVTTSVAPLNIRAYNVVQLIEEFDELYRPIADKKGLGFGYREGDFSIAIDDEAFDRIVRNLLINAIQSTETGAVILSLRQFGNRCKVAVWDSGCGIEGARGFDGATNFNNFVARLKQDGAIAAHDGGHGIGLANIGQLCTTIGATMTLRSRVGRGSVFRFFVPIADAATPDGINVSD